GVVEQLPGGLGPRVAPVDRRRLRRIERRERPPLQLSDIPVGVRERQGHNRYVLADVLDFLRVPQGEGVVAPRRHQHAVGLDRLQQIVREITRQRLTLARGGEVIPPQRDQRQDQYRRRERPAARGVRHTDLESIADPFHDRREPHPDPHPPQRERRDEEVIALTHLARELLLGLPRVAVLEVQVEDQEQRERPD